MSAADQVWLKQTVERQIEDISADVGEIWEKIGRLECGFEMLISHLDAQTGRLNEQTDKLNELVTAYNNIAGDFRKLCNLLAQPAPPPPSSELFNHLAAGMRQAPPSKPAKSRKPKLKIVKDEEPAS